MADRFEAGSNIVRRTVHRDRVWSAWPCRVVHDTGDELALAAWPGVEILNQVTSIEALGKSKDRSQRFRSLSDLASGEPELGTSMLLGSTILAFHHPDRYFGVSVFFGANGEPRHWYVNFERPFTRTAIGIDTFDLMLDLIVEPDGTHRWKDEDEYAYGRRLGLVTDHEHAEIETARDQAFAMLEAREGPFDERWLGWRPDPAWPVPTLPDDVTHVPGDGHGARVT